MKIHFLGGNQKRRQTVFAATVAAAAKTCINFIENEYVYVYLGISHKLFTIIIIDGSFAGSDGVVVI